MMIMMMTLRMKRMLMTMGEGECMGRLKGSREGGKVEYSPHVKKGNEGEG